MSEPYETILEVSIKKLINNFNYLKAKLNSNTKIIAVVKAYAYGHGDIMIAKPPPLQPSHLPPTTLNEKRPGP